MTQNRLGMVRIASGSPGNRFLLYNNVFLYYKTEPFFPIIYYPYSPVRFPIPLVDPLGAVDDSPAAPTGYPTTSYNICLRLRSLARATGPVPGPKGR